MKVTIRILTVILWHWWKVFHHGMFQETVSVEWILCVTGYHLKYFFLFSLKYIIKDCRWMMMKEMTTYTLLHQHPDLVFHLLLPCSAHCSSIPSQRKLHAEEKNNFFVNSTLYHYNTSGFLMVSWSWKFGRKVFFIRKILFLVNDFSK